MSDSLQTAAKRQRWRERAEEREWTFLQKGGLIVLHLFQGDGMRTCDVADLMGVSQWKTADRAMALLQAAMPGAIKRDDDGFWYMDHTQLTS